MPEQQITLFEDDDNDSAEGLDIDLDDMKKLFMKQRIFEINK